MPEKEGAAWEQCNKCSTIQAQLLATLGVLLLFSFTSYKSENSLALLLLGVPILTLHGNFETLTYPTAFAAAE